ncbi:MAG: hypothetical protein J5722_08270 [Oscillospiraceae bacterium]|nr:hypothetical protein [Oscillospiraceae bacterium]
MANQDKIESENARHCRAFTISLQFWINRGIQRTSLEVKMAVNTRGDTKDLVHAKKSAKKV